MKQAVVKVQSAAVNGVANAVLVIKGTSVNRNIIIFTIIGLVKVVRISRCSAC